MIPRLTLRTTTGFTPASVSRGFNLPVHFVLPTVTPTCPDLLDSDLRSLPFVGSLHEFRYLPSGDLCLQPLVAACGCFPS